MDSTILDKENEERSIEMLAAQKEIYSEGKRLYGVNFFISVLLIVLASFLQILFPDLKFLNLLIALLSVLAVLSDNILDCYISELKEKATKIKECFDSYVLNIEWNFILCGDKPEYSEICKSYTKYTKAQKLDLLKNWYPEEIKLVSGTTGTIICQKVNCLYDSTLRKIYNFIIISIGIFAITILIFVGIWTNITLPDVFLTVLFPCCPIIQWTLKSLKDNNSSIQTLKHLNSLINSTWERLKKGEVIEKHLIRQIQDGIYVKRISNLLIPDYLYNLRRKYLEKEMNYSVKELVKEFNQK